MIPMVPYRCYKCRNWLRELTVEKLDHNYMTVYLCLDCERGYEADDNEKCPNKLISFKRDLKE